MAAKVAAKLKADLEAKAAKLKADLEAKAAKLKAEIEAKAVADELAAKEAEAERKRKHIRMLETKA